MKKLTIEDVVNEKHQKRGVRSTKEYKRRKRPLYYAWVYILESQGAYKIGYAKDVSSRLVRLQTGNPFKINFVFARAFFSAQSIEGAIHILYSQCKIRGEWFALNEEQLQHIIDNLEEINEKKFHQLKAKKLNPKTA